MQKSFFAEAADKEKVRSIRKAALDLLARREHSVVELQRKLLKKFSEYELIDQVLLRLMDEKLVSDERFTESYIHYRSKAGFGPQRISVELKERGVKEDLANRLIYDESICWESIAVKAKLKKFGDKTIKSMEEKSRQMRFLQYRGFAHSHIEIALS